MGLEWLCDRFSTIDCLDWVGSGWVRNGMHDMGQVTPQPRMLRDGPCVLSHMYGILILPHHSTWSGLTPVRLRGWWDGTGGRFNFILDWIGVRLTDGPARARAQAQTYSVYRTHIFLDSAISSFLCPSVASERLAEIPQPGPAPMIEDAVHL